MSKETREIAYDIIARWKRDIGQVVKYEQMIADVDKALRDERERCAKVVDEKINACDRTIKLNDEQGRDWGYGCWRDISNALRTTAAAIRNGVADAK
jgi:hypothetical protein